VWSATKTLSGGAAFYGTGSVDLALDAGVSYVFGVGLTGATTWYRSTSADLSPSGPVKPLGYVVEVSSPAPRLLSQDASPARLVAQRLALVHADLVDQDQDGDGWTPFCGDCSDVTGRVNPEAEEVCDGWDNDCDGTIDGADSLDVVIFYADRDGDGWGDAATAEDACEPPADAVLNGEDCDDADADVWPGAPGLDDDCAPVTDDDTGVPPTPAYDPDTGIAADTDPPIEADTDEADPTDPGAGVEGSRGFDAPEEDDDGQFVQRDWEDAASCGCATSRSSGSSAFLVVLFGLLTRRARRG